MARRIAACAFAILVVLTSALRAEPLRIAVISDLNGSYGSVEYDPAVSAAVRRIISLKPDLVISTGDMVAGQRRPHLSEPELRSMWAAFHASVTIPLARAGIPLAVTPGNHDASAYDGFERERRIFAEEWRRHKPELAYVGTGEYPFSYAFDMGGVRFVSMDVTRVGPVDPRQMQWLSEAVAQAGPARIAFSHLPIWPFAHGRETEVIGDPAVETRLIDLGFDLHLSGHHHAFFAGGVGDLAVVSQACLGSGPRKLIGEQGRSTRAITLVEVSEEGEMTVSALAGPEFAKPVQIATLPDVLLTPQRVLKRLDIAQLPRVRWQERAGYGAR